MKKNICLIAAIALSISAPLSVRAAMSSSLPDFILGASEDGSKDYNNDGVCDTFDLICMRSEMTSYNQVYVSTTDELLNALKNAQAGDEIIVAEGEYENDVWTGKWAAFYSAADGTSDKKIILRSENPDNPAVLKGVSNENKMGLYITGDYWEIRDISVSTVQKGIVLDNSNNSIIDNCEVYNTGAEGIHLRDNSSNCTVSECYVHDTGLVSPSYGEAIYIGSAYSTTDYGYDCNNNLITHCELGPNVTAEHIDIKEYTTGNIVEYCVFDATGMSGANYADSFTDVKGNNCKIRYNTGYRNNAAAIAAAFQVHVAVDGWGQNNEIYGNTVYMDVEAGYVVDAWDCLTTVYDNKRYPDGEMYLGDTFITEPTKED